MLVRASEAGAAFIGCGDPSGIRDLVAAACVQDIPGRRESVCDGHAVISMHEKAQQVHGTAGQDEDGFNRTPTP